MIICVYLHFETKRLSVLCIIACFAFWFYFETLSPSLSLSLFDCSVSFCTNSIFIPIDFNLAFHWFLFCILFSIYLDGLLKSFVRCWLALFSFWSKIGSLIWLNLIQDQHNTFNFSLDGEWKEETKKAWLYLLIFFSQSLMCIFCNVFSLFICTFCSITHTIEKHHSHEHTTRSFVVSALMLSEVVLAKSSFYTAIHWDLSDYWILIFHISFALLLLIFDLFDISQLYFLWLTAYCACLNSLSFSHCW